MASTNIRKKVVVSPSTVTLSNRFSTLDAGAVRVYRVVEVLLRNRKCSRFPNESTIIVYFPIRGSDSRDSTCRRDWTTDLLTALNFTERGGIGF